MIISYTPVKAAGSDAAGFMGRLRENLAGRYPIGTRIALAKNEYAYSCGDRDQNIYFLESGRLKTVAFSPSGKECLLRICCPGEIFGEQGASETARGESTIAMHDSVMRRMPYSRFLSAIKTEGLIGDYIAFLSHRLCEQQQAITNLATVDSEQRLAVILLDLANKIGNDDPTRTCLEQRLTHEDLAKMVGTTRSRIGFFLKAFQREGLINISQNSRLIVHRHLLSEYLNMRHA